MSPILLFQLEQRHAQEGTDSVLFSTQVEDTVTQVQHFIRGKAEMSTRLSGYM